MWLIRQGLRGTGRGDVSCVALWHTYHHCRTRVRMFSAPKNGRLCRQAVLRSRDQLILAGQAGMLLRGDISVNGSFNYA